MIIPAKQKALNNGCCALTRSGHWRIVLQRGRKTSNSFASNADATFFSLREFTVGKNQDGLELDGREPTTEASPELMEKHFSLAGSQN